MKPTCPDKVYCLLQVLASAPHLLPQFCLLQPLESIVRWAVVKNVFGGLNDANMLGKQSLGKFRSGRLVVHSVIVGPNFLANSLCQLQ